MKIKYIVLGWIMACGVFGCARATSDELIESYIALETVMERYADNPSALFSAMDDCIEKYAPVWTRAHHILETKNFEHTVKEYNVRSKTLTAHMQRLLDLDLEIQDRLKSRPDLLIEYNQRVQRIGRQDGGNQ